MSVTVLVGAQWGDEGKGKIIDVLTRDVDMVIRFQGGNNAGHTVEIGDQKYVLHLIPSGIFRPDTINIIGNGLVVDPLALQEEMEGLIKRGIAVKNLQLSDKAHLIMPYHKLMDAMKEGQLAEGKKIGTTKRGIGPAYTDKADRCGIRALELLDLAEFRVHFTEQAEKYNRIFAAAGQETLDIDAEWLQLKAAAEYLKPYIKDTVLEVNQAARAGKNILFEGAQGALLDVDHGTYPFVTSSNTTSGGACTGSGLSPRYIQDVYGVIKAYTTRVGEGPFQTELHGPEGEALRKAGNEYGATTGRPRRCGWFDAVASRYSCMVNGINKLAITKLDVLDRLPEVKLCVAYDIDGKRYEEMPSDSRLLYKVKPVYETLPGWMCSTDHVSCWDDLPEKAKKYLRRLAELVDAEIGIVSVGPNRSQTFEL
ncbi:MAG: adenylosuccinate synthase [Victivallales bacterium]|nr:adenylosuccinate synthase [Victivallales bacterium]